MNKIHATFFEGFCLLSKYFPGLSRQCLAHLSKDPQRADRAGDQNLMFGRFPGLARDFDAAVIEFRDTVLQAERVQFVPVRSKRVGLDDMSAGFEVGHMNTKHGLGARGIQFIHAALRPQGFME
jgi:hypothetical protein